MSQTETPVTIPEDSSPADGAGLPSHDAAPAGSGPLITEGPYTNSPQWSRRRAVATGAVVGALFGIVFFAGYAGTSAWICSSRLDCGHWAPIAIVAGAGALGSTLLGAGAALFLHRIYRMFKVV